MRLVALYSVLLVVGIVLSQVLPGIVGPAWQQFSWPITVLTMVGLAFIMIHVGYEFELDKSNLRQYGWDYIVAATAATFPWIFAAVYFVFVMLPPQIWSDWGAWKESLLLGRFAAPTSAGVLFSMLAAAGLSATWLFRKVRILAIFDDLDTVLLMIPLKILIAGWSWSMLVMVVAMLALLWAAWRYLHAIRLPVSWPWVLGYSVGIALGCEALYLASKWVLHIGVHMEVLLPAFVLGCMMARPPGTDPHVDDCREGHQEGPEHPTEQRVSRIVSGVFMVLVGLNMPQITAAPLAEITAETITESRANLSVFSSQPFMGWGMVLVHVVVLTVLINLGKMFPVCCYRREASLRERLAVCIGMWPRGEVGAGILTLSLSYGIGGPAVTIAMLCLALNLLLTGLYILAVQRLIAKDYQTASTGPIDAQ